MNPDDMLRPRKGMTSVQAAEAYLDAEYAQSRIFDMDSLARSGIARSMGFDFDVTIDWVRKRFICIDKTTGYKTTAYYTEMDDKAIKRLVRALTRLKTAHDSLEH